MNKGLFDQQGRPIFGHHYDDIDHVAIEQYQHRTVTGNKAGWWPSWIGLKQFQYFGIISPTLLGGCAIAHLRHTAVVFLYLYHPDRGMLLETSKRAPLGLGVTLTNDLRRGTSESRIGDIHVQLSHHGSRKRLIISSPDCQGNLWFDEAETEILSLCSQIGRNGWAYARKVAGVRCYGELSCHGERFDMAELDAFAHHDFTSGYLRRETFWNWACLSGLNRSGDAIGLNLSCGVNETSFSENALWLNGVLHPLPQCQFVYDANSVDEPWQIRSDDGAIQLRFTPAGSHKERLNLLLFASDFKQLFGRFDGQIIVADGKRIDIEQQWGFVEDQYAKW